MKHTSSGAAGPQKNRNHCNMILYYKDCVDYIIPLISLIVSIVACVYAIKTYRKSHSILDVIQHNRDWKWNKKQLEYLFSYLPINSIDSFFNHPNIIRADLWWGLSMVDLDYFQFEGKEKNLIIQFINGLDDFRDLNYLQTPSKHWKYEPIPEHEPFDENKEQQEIERLYSKASDLKPLYQEIKRLLTAYNVDLREINNRAYDQFLISTTEQIDILTKQKNNNL